MESDAVRTAPFELGVDRLGDNDRPSRATCGLFQGSKRIPEVKKNGLFVIPGIGRLVRVDRKARMGRNPATGGAIKIPAKKVVKFRVAKAAKDAIVPPKVKKAKA